MSNNAEASSSRVPSNTMKRGRAESRSRPDKGKEKDDGGLKSPNPSANNGSMRTLSPRSGGGSISAREGGSTARRVRTVPPSAIYEPPTPPSPVHSPLPHLANPLSTLPPSQTPKKQRRHRLRYSSSSDSSNDSDDESSDDEPPWWTFTQRGMAKLRAKNLNRNGRDVEQGGGGEHLTEGESGKESGKERENVLKDKRRLSGVFLSSSRRSSKDKESININTNVTNHNFGNGSTPSSSIKNFRKITESPLTLPSSTSTHGPSSSSKLLHPAPIRFSNTQQFFKRSGSNQNRQDILPSLETIPTNIKRSKSNPTRPASAPNSPTVEVPSPGLTTLVNDGLSSRLPSNEDPQPPQLSFNDLSQIQSRQFNKRQLTAPNFPKFFRRNDTDEEPIEALTDTEIIPTSRSKSKSSLSKPKPIPGLGLVHPQTSTPIGSSKMIRSNTGSSTPDQGGQGSSSTPTRPRTNKRLSSHMLRIQLPPPITNRFKEGWPHPGSWQDALYGYYEEDGNGAPAIRPSSKSRKSTMKSEVSQANIEDDPSTPQRAEFSMSEQDEEATQRTSPDKNSGNGETVKRTKTRKQKRYRQALVPPTPSGLGFTPSTRTGIADEYPWNKNHDPEKGFDWTSGLAPKETQSQSQANQNGGGPKLNGGENLVRQDTTATTTGTSTTQSLHRGNEKGWWILGGGKGKKSDRKKRKEDKKKRSRQIDPDWRQRYRRKLFLDARVTIWIRLINLAIVVVSLGLAITIRLELEHLRLPGLIGSSTTLIMAYSCLTILHVLTAIYREYFGKPIGLWGLRSKMLWVCLDLLFVAFWSSAISLSTNDLISTPLECTKGSAWWRKGLSSEYSQLLDELKELQPSINSTTQIISSKISHSLSISLPTQILDSPLAHEACRRQVGVITLSLLSLLLYGGNMVISLFRIFETVRRTANVSKAVTL